MTKVNEYSTRVCQAVRSIRRIFGKYKVLLQLGLLILTIVLFVWYFSSNRNEFAKLASLSLIQFVFIFAGQTIAFTGNVIIIYAFGRFIGRHLPGLEITKVGAYSSVVNFFGFFQGGFGVRGAYLKVSHGMTIKKYLGVSAIQYLILFTMAGVLVLAGLLTTGVLWPLALVGIGTLGMVGLVLVFSWVPVARRKAQVLRRQYGGLLQTSPILWLCLGTVIYLAGGLLAFGTELSAVGASLTLSGLLVYTGVTQFTILIALTPGGLGVREAALLLVQQQMALSTSDIILASTLDRGVYFITLGVLFIISSGASSYVSKGNSHS